MAELRGHDVSMDYIGVPIVVVMMLVAQRVESRLGPAAAGWIAALPAGLGIAAAVIAVSEGTDAGSKVAFSAVGHIAPMIVYVVAFVWATSRFGIVRGFLLAAVTDLIVSLAFQPILEPIQIALGILAIPTGGLLIRGRLTPVESHKPVPKSQRALSLMSAATAVALIGFVNNLGGPVVAGAFAAFPTMTTTIALFVAYRSNVSSAHNVMGGLVSSLPIYLTYGIIFGLLVVKVGTPWAIVAATGAALVVAKLTWARVDRTDPHRPSPAKTSEIGLAQGH